MSAKLERVVLKNLILNHDFVQKALPYVKQEYFQDDTDKLAFKLIINHIGKYNVSPTPESLLVELESLQNINETTYKDSKEWLQSITKEKPESNLQWLLDSAEKFCQERAMYLAMTKSIEIMNGSGKEDRGVIPKLLADSLTVSFNPSVGHDYFDNSESRYEYYHQRYNQVPFDLELLNIITNGGLRNKTLNVAVGGTGVGKSLFMCHVAAAALSAGNNVLYITLELSQEEVAKRVDANLLNVTLDDLVKMPKDTFSSKMAKLKPKTNGRLIIKEYPTSGASVLHFKSLLNELKLKKKFSPALVIIDYINICSSSRIKASEGSNTYTYIKAIAEELRGMAVEYDIPILTATQVNRAGYADSDFGLENTSESFGLPATADFMFALISTEELESLGQIMIKQLKNRYSDPSKNKRFVVGVDRSKMRLFDLENTAQTLANSGVVSQPVAITSQQKVNKFSKLKVGVIDNVQV